ncbi:hypothetical protein ACWF94_37575 [Streptomyces sp. NPDC055078]
MHGVTGPADDAHKGREPTRRGRSATVASAVGLLCAHFLTAYLMYPAFTSPAMGAAVGVPLIIAFHLGLATEWLTNLAVRAGLLSFWWYIPPAVLTITALVRLGAFMD